MPGCADQAVHTTAPPAALIFFSAIFDTSLEWVAASRWTTRTRWRRSEERNRRRPDPSRRRERGIDDGAVELVAEAVEVVHTDLNYRSTPDGTRRSGCGDGAGRRDASYACRSARVRHSHGLAFSNSFFNRVAIASDPSALGFAKRKKSGATPSIYTPRGFWSSE